MICETYITKGENNGYQAWKIIGETREEINMLDEFYRKGLHDLGIISGFILEAEKAVLDILVPIDDREDVNGVMYTPDSPLFLSEENQSLIFVDDYFC